MTTAQLEIDVPADEPVIRFRRFVAAKPGTVWRAWTEPELVQKWLGPRYLTTTLCESDLRVGGAWRFVQTAPDGPEHPFHGEYLEVDPPRRLARTFVYDPWPDDSMEEWVELEEVEGGDAAWREPAREPREPQPPRRVRHGARHERVDGAAGRAAAVTLSGSAGLHAR